MQSFRCVTEATRDDVVVADGADRRPAVQLGGEHHFSRASWVSARLSMELEHEAEGGNCFVKADYLLYHR